MKKSFSITYNKVLNIFLVLLILFISFFTFNQQAAALEQQAAAPENHNETISPQPHPLVAHAGGAIYGYKYTNSLEAMEEAYKNGFRLLEIDFDWTSDNEVVAIHDWTAMPRRLFMIEPRVLTLKEFKNPDTFQGLTLMDIRGIVSWLRIREDAYIITDVKNRNIEFLELLARNYADIKGQIIPQIYSFEEYTEVKAMGYNNIILTLYQNYYTDDELVKFVGKNKVFAVTMPLERGYTDLPMKLKERNIPTYVHTVNDLHIFEALHKNGVTGIYTDYFHANRLSL